MKMKNFKVMAALAAVLMLLSCQQEDDFAGTPQPATPASEDYTLTEDEGSFDPDAHNGVRLFMDMAENYLHTRYP